MNQEDIGKLIRKLRLDNNMSQAQLAKKLSVTSQAISKWENGRGIPDIEFLKRLSEIFNINIDDLIRGKISDNSSSNKKSNHILFIFLIILVVIIGIIILYFNHSSSSFNFTTLDTNNDKFSIAGVMASDKNKKSIYISKINYTGSEDNTIYKGLECVLYESVSHEERIITKCDSLNKEDTLSNLLDGVSFNVDDYSCSCNDKSCNKLYIRIGAINDNGAVVSYNVPVQVDNKCSNK